MQTKKPDSPVIRLISFRSNSVAKKIEIDGILNPTRLPPENLRVTYAGSETVNTEILDSVNAVIIGGFWMSVFQDWPNATEVRETLKEAHRRHLPMLGICFGHQVLAQLFGGEVIRDNEREEYGTFDVFLLGEAEHAPLFAGLPKSFLAQCAHEDRVVRLPPHAVLLAESDRCPIQAFALPEERVFGVQFHPEFTKESLNTLMGMASPNLASHSGGVEAVRKRLREAPDAGLVLDNFVNRIVIG